jgi:hypothetical protein
MAMNAELLAILLPVLAKAQYGYEALAHDLPHVELFAGDEAVEGIDPVPVFKVKEELDADLVAALHDAARRSAVAQLASLLACADRACRAAVDAFASAEERAAQAAQAQATQYIAQVLQSCANPGRYAAQPPLAAWCRTESAATALARHRDKIHPADKWRGFARKVAFAAEIPRRVLIARTKRAEHQAQQMAAMMAGQPAPPPLANGGALAELADVKLEDWSAWLVDVLQGAPA